MFIRINIIKLFVQLNFCNITYAGFNLETEKDLFFLCYTRIIS